MLKAGDEPIPGYRLERFLGKGQFGQVWQCTTPGKASAALKFLDLSGKQGWKEFRGIQRVKAIRHPHLMPITALWLLDEHLHLIDDADLSEAEARATAKVAETLRPTGAMAGREEPRWLVVAQLLADKTLGDLLNEYRARGAAGIPVEPLLRYMEEAAKGIDYLNSSNHDLGEGRAAVQHCDIKPANILLVGDSVLICDFGVVQVLSGETSATATGMVGSPAYMAPECVERRPSLASDQYSLAVTYVELRTGRLPFKSETYVDVIDAHRQGKLDLSGLAPAERAVIRRATSVNPKHRYATVAEMVRELRGAVEGKAAPRGSRRRQVVMLVTTLVAMATAIGLFVVTVTRWPGKGESESAPQRFALRVTPADALVTLDGQPQSLDAQGQGTFEHAASGSIELAVSKEPEYQAEQRQIGLGEHLTGPIEVRLKYRPDYLAGRGTQRWQQGDPSGALDDYVAAIRADAAFAVFPAAHYLLAKDAERAVYRMTLSLDGRWVVCGGQSGRVVGWDLNSGNDAFQARTLQQHDHPIESLSAGRQWLAAADLGGRVVVSRLEADVQPASDWQLAENLIKLLITPDERWLLAGSDDGSGKYLLQRWDLQTPALASSGVKLGVQGGMISEILLPQGRATVVTASWDRTVREWQLTPSAATAEGHLLGQLTGDVYCLAQIGDLIAFAGDGSDALSPTANPTAANFRPHRIVLVAADGGPCQVLPEGHEEQIEVLKASPSGTRLASGSVDGMIQVWEAADQTLRGPTVLGIGHAGKVNSLSFDSTADWLVSGGDDGAVLLWDLQQPTEVTVIGRHEGPVNQVVILPDGTAAISCGEDGSVRRWDLPKCQLIKRACRRLQVDPKPYVESDQQVET